MCRFAFKKYKPHYVCFDCRKSFKQPLLEDIIIQNGQWDLYRKIYLYPKSKEAIAVKNENPELLKEFESKYINRKYICPDCGQEMYNIGLDFKAPKKDKIKEWKIIESLYSLGNNFHSCGCYGPGYIPNKKDYYLKYLEDMKVEYESNLKKRDTRVDNENISEYIEYWNIKLDTLIREIEKVKNSWIQKKARRLRSMDFF